MTSSASRGKSEQVPRVFRAVAGVATFIASLGMTIPSSARFGSSLVTPTEAEQRVQQIKARPFSKVPELLVDDIRNTLKEIEEIDGGIADATGELEARKTPMLPEDTREALEGLRRLDLQRCNPELLKRANTLGRQLYNDAEEESELERQGAQIRNAGTCDELKQLIGKLPTAEEIQRQLTEAGDRKDRQLRESIEATKRVRAALEERMATAESKSATAQLEAKKSESFFQRDLGVLVGIVAAFSILLLVVVRFYAEEVQVEWVQSGQVIQFLTVMVLLTSIMTLGILGKLTEQVLGTLLGGIAGYVLAQGVGRAAKHEALKRQEQS